MWKLGGDVFDNGLRTHSEVRSNFETYEADFCSGVGR